METTLKRISVILSLMLCVLTFTSAAAAVITPFKSTIFGSYSVSLSSSMTASFQVTTRKPVSSVSLSASLQVWQNGKWKTCSTSVSPSFSGKDKTAWTTDADYSGDCTKGQKYRVTVTYSAGGTSVSRTSSSKTY